MIHKKRKHQRAGRVVTTVIALVGAVTGIAAPALALTRTDNNSGWADHQTSVRWTDSTPGYTDSRVTTSVGCKTRDFQMTIREDRSFAPDPNRGSEWIDCLSYTDAVYANSSTDFSKEHHYDITGLGSTFNYGCECNIANLETFTATVRW